MLMYLAFSITFEYCFAPSTNVRSFPLFFPEETKIFVFESNFSRNRKKDGLTDVRIVGAKDANYARAFENFSRLYIFTRGQNAKCPANTLAITVYYRFSVSSVPLVVARARDRSIR